MIPLFRPFARNDNRTTNLHTGESQLRKDMAKRGAALPDGFVATRGTTATPEDFQSAIAGPPSPERIRAYTEQMKRSSIFGSNSRSDTLSSASSSSRSRSESLSLSRKSSSRSTTAMSSYTERPESVPIFGKTIFTRKSKRDQKASNGPPSFNESEEEFSDNTRPSTRDTSYGTDGERLKSLISGPYNFQHVTHTRPDHVPNLGRASRLELSSEFSAHRASQAPTRGELKGIKTQELNFDNFSSEELSIAGSGDDNRSPTSPRSSPGRKPIKIHRKSKTPPQLKRVVSAAKSVDNLRSTPPPRPPRSPLSPTCPVALPARTSSRTASVLFDTFDPLAIATIDRPHTQGGFRRPSPFNVLLPPTPEPLQEEYHEDDQQQDDIPEQYISHAVTTLGKEAWPLSSPAMTFSDLPDVQEEEDDHLHLKRSRMSTASAELRASHSVPALRSRSLEQPNERPDTGLSSSTIRKGSNDASSRKSPLSASFELSEDWERDVDFAYENELEADDDYQWASPGIESSEASTNVTTVEQPELDLHLGEGHHVPYHGRFRPSLLVPSANELPELSTLSAASTTSDLQTPAGFLRPIHTRSTSHASSFKESHGFNLSPSLLIPSDFSSQIEQDALYDEHYRNVQSAASIFVQDSYPISPFDESTSSTASHRSSQFSRGSARSSSSTRMSGAHSRVSQDSLKTTSIGPHRSFGSTSSLPDLIPSVLRRSQHNFDMDITAGVSTLNLDNDTTTENLEPSQSPNIPSQIAAPHRRNKSSTSDIVARKGINHFAPPPPILAACDSLSPVAESFAAAQSSPQLYNEIGGGSIQAHERKASVPILNSNVKEFKGRARSATASSGSDHGGRKHSISGAKARGSYMLFPQT
jgi:hypothetical protein